MGIFGTEDIYNKVKMYGINLILHGVNVVNVFADQLIRDDELSHVLHHDNHDALNDLGEEDL